MLPMAESIQSSQPVEEKAVMQHHEHIDTAQHGHQEMTRPGSEEGMHESEKDIPVGFGCSICGYDSTDHWKDDLPPLHGIYCHGFLVDWESDPGIPLWYVKNNIKAMI
jgi:hypothetical protein